MENTARIFHLPNGLSVEQQVTFCLQIIHKQRQELAPLRKKLVLCQRYHDPLLDIIRAWKEKYQKEKTEKEDLQKENEKLKKKIEKLTKTNERYRVALFDHGNLKSPTDKKEKKQKGGQDGHADTNNDSKRDYQSFSKQRIFTRVCAGCGNPLTRANGIKEKTLIDVKINTNVLQMIIESERQWCSTCKKEVRVVHPQ